MANKDDYLTSYREFFENFAKNVNPNDQLPVRLGSYKFLNVEVVGGIIDWTTQYLTKNNCPPSLFGPLIKIIIDEIRKECKKDPISCGFNKNDDAYEPLKLMQTVMGKTNEVCMRYLDNSKLCSLPPPGPPFNQVSVFGMKNSRRRMEDRHVVLHDLSTMFNSQEGTPSSYYAIFDGHAGHDAAAYSAAHLHQFLAESKYFISDPQRALLDAYIKTDTLFLEKCRVENLNGGTTAVCALLRPKEKLLYIAWAGDSQALLAKQGRILQCVDPHKPGRQDERERIEKAGGCVMLWGTWRVNGQLAVSRAIGDLDYKPYVTAQPDIIEIALDGNEDFLILACDGLWDFLSEDAAANEVYHLVRENPDNTEDISKHLCNRAKQGGSTDNISVIVVFLRDPSKIAAEANWANRNGCSTNTMDASLDNANNPFSTSNGAADIQQQKSSAEGLLLNLDSFKSNNGTEFSPDEFFNNDLAPSASNGKKMSPFDGDDFGPETDVDAVDEAVLSPSSLTTAKAMAEGICNNNPEMGGGFNPFMDEPLEELKKNEDKKDMEIEQAFRDDVVMDFKPSSPREETPTPPADTVHDGDGGLIENPGDSESEDEWNYFKGDDANKETRNLSQSEKEIAETSEDDNMSNLNPNAAEFVPVSPTRSAPSPICKALLNDEVIAQSPKRPTQNELDINVPSPVDFEKEVKSRPSEVDMFTTNGHSDNELNDSTSSQENRENQDPQQAMDDGILNGKNVDEIAEFQPSPIKAVDEFHFGPNAAPFSPARALDQSETGLSTRAVCGDESAFNTSFNESDMMGNTQEMKEIKDSMSMSIYQDKDEGNPFDKPDLNQVQMLPDNLDEFLQKSNESEEKLVVEDSMSETISEVPKSNLIEEESKEKAVVDEEKELASPLNETSELDSDFVKNTSDISPEQEEKLLADDQDDKFDKKDEIMHHAPVQQENVADLLGSNDIFSKSPAMSPISDKPVEFQDSTFVAASNETQNHVKESEESLPAPEPLAEIASPTIDNTLVPEVCPISTPESVATTDVNSFLDRSELPDVASPLSPNEQKMDEALSQLADQAIPDVLSKCVFPLPPENHQFDVRTENITPEFAEEAILSPGEESKHSDEVPTAPLVEEEPVKDLKVMEVKEEAPIVEKVAPAAAEAIKTEVKENKAKKPEQKTEKDVKKLSTDKKTAPGAKTAAKPTSATAKPSSASTAARKPIAKAPLAATKAPASTKTATSTTTASKPAPRPATARPKTAPTAAKTTAGPTERKPLTNGVTKTTSSTARSTLTAKKTDSLTKTPTKPAGTGAAASATRTTPLKSTKLSSGATTANKTAASPRAAPASRPMTLSRPATARTTTTSTAKTSTTTAARTISSTTTSRTNTTRPTTARTTTTTTTTLSKPRVPATRTVTKSSNPPDTEKQLKESANKMTASRTATRTTTTTVRKTTEAKALGNRTNASKTTTSATTKTTSAAKKPAEIVRSKTTKTTKIEKPKENGVAATTTTTTVVTEQLIAVNDDVRNNGEEVVKDMSIPNDLIKDNSPIDNKLILENNTLNETTTAAD